MLARLQRTLMSFAVSATLAWVVWFGLSGHGALALAGIAAFIFGHALVLGAEFVMVALTRGEDPAPRASAWQLLKAWSGEIVTAPIVFGWRQPFRADAIADDLAGRPGTRGVLFVHGFVCNRAFWNPWFTRLREQGIAYASVNLEPVFGSIDAYPPLIEAALRRLEAATGMPPLVVCHSMGGLAMRAWMRDNAAAGGSDTRIHHVVTIGSPHGGTWLARWAFSANGRQMRINSPWLASLTHAEPPDRFTRFTCVYGHCDNIVFPASSAVLQGAHSLHVEATAHVDLAFHATSYQEAMRCLFKDRSTSDLAAKGAAAVANA